MSAVKKKKKFDYSVEKQILIGMITSTKFLSEFKHFYRPELFKLPFSKIISIWCFDYFNKYGRSPQYDIQDIFNEHSEKLDDTIFKAVENVLVDLSDTYENQRLNYKRLLDKAELYMQARNTSKMLLEAQNLVDNNRIKEAETLIKNFRQIKKEDREGIDLFRDVDRVVNIITQRKDNVLFRFKGAAGKIIPDFCREQFIAFAGPEKRGKSWNLQELGKHGVIRGYKVAHFNFEMPEEQLIGRYVQNFTGTPGDKDDEGKLIPVFDCEINQIGGCKRAAKLGINLKPLVKDIYGDIPLYENAHKDYHPCTICKDSNLYEYRLKYMPTIWFKENKKKVLDKANAKRSILKLKKYFKSGSLRWVSWPSDTKSVEDIRNQLLRWEEEDGWMADIIITDYADLMVPSKRIDSYRHGIDDIWKGHKRLGQEFHAGVASATQTNTSTYLKRIQEDDLSEDKRKASHTDRMIALNQTEEEYNRNIIRWSLLFERHKKKTKNDLVILQHLPVGNPFLDCYIDENPFGTKSRKKKKRN